MHKRITCGNKLIFAMLIFLVSVNVSLAQTTEFTYQGKLLDGAVPPTANYDFEFRLFSVDTGGMAIITQQRLNVAVTGGIFTVKLDFGANFNGGPRWLEIAVRPAGGGSFTTLAPRQPVTATPYAVQSLNAVNATTATNATQLGGVAASQYVVTTDTRLADDRNPLAGSINYIQNASTLQTSSNFHISGNGTANTFNAQMQFNLGGQRLLSAPGAANLFAGLSAGAANTTGQSNAFVGALAGLSNTTGTDNAFFGNVAGRNNTTGGLNLINRLRPITFTWKDGGLRDLGLGAEEVERVEPLLVTYNRGGKVEGVKYDRVAVVLLNAVKEQQTQIASQQAQIKQQAEQMENQQREIEALKKLLCPDHPEAEICKAPARR